MDDFPNFLILNSRMTKEEIEKRKKFERKRTAIYHLSEMVRLYEIDSNITVKEFIDANRTVEESTT